MDEGRKVSGRSWDVGTRAPWRLRAYEIIFEHDTAGGKAFDVILMAAILVSVAVVMLDSVSSVSAPLHRTFFWAEWIFTLLFTVEYLLRLASAPRALGYTLSFFGVVDLLAVLPTYLSLLLPGGQYFIVIRVLRVLRVFRVLKLARFVGEARTLGLALKAARFKITVFLFTVLTIVVVVGSLMFLIEGPENGFTSIPQGVYWAIVTMTTVGYGDVAPVTGVGKTLAALVMILGYGIIAVPTGIVTVELAHHSRASTPSLICGRCGEDAHESDARYCRKCGEGLETLRRGPELGG